MKSQLTEEMQTSRSKNTIFSVSDWQKLTKL